MSRRSQDIPIRPRYGLPDSDSPKDTEPEDSRNQSTQLSSNAPPMAEEMASSYSEIPFLAQYPGARPDPPPHDVTPTPAANLQCSDNDDNDSADDAEEEDDSKSSSGEASRTPKRPHSLHTSSSFPYELESASDSDCKMRHFVANNLEEKLRTSVLNKKDHLGSTSQNSTPSSSALLTRHFLQTQTLQVDANVLSDIEIEAQYLAASVDNLTDNLCNLLHSISSITADNVEVHKNAVNKLTDSMDANIKCMYTIMAKTEEISKSMKPTEQLGQRIREIKRLVDMLENTM